MTDIEQMQIGDKAKEYIFTMIGECVGCIEVGIAQDVDGNKIVHVTDSHGGVGFISNGSTRLLKAYEPYMSFDDVCSIPDDMKRGLHICDGCWMNIKTNEAKDE